MKSGYLLLAGSLLLIGLHGREVQPNPETSQQDLLSTVQDAIARGGMLVYIRDVQREDGRFTLSVDPIEGLFRGGEARRAIAGDHPLCADATRAGCEIAHDAYIRDHDMSPVSQPLADDARVILDRHDPYVELAPLPLSTAAFQPAFIRHKAHLLGVPFLVTFDSRGQIDRVEEQFAPFFRL